MVRPGCQPATDPRAEFADERREPDNDEQGGTDKDNGESGLSGDESLGTVQCGHRAREVNQEQQPGLTAL